MLEHEDARQPQCTFTLRKFRESTCPLSRNYYFAPHAVQNNVIDVIRDKKEYHRLFKDAKGHIATGEATNIYLWDPDAARLIHQTVPHARIIMSLRDPIERTYSVLDENEV